MINALRRHANTQNKTADPKAIPAHDCMEKVRPVTGREADLGHAGCRAMQNAKAEAQTRIKQSIISHSREGGNPSMKMPCMQNQ
jgi:hypothetical protein